MYFVTPKLSLCNWKNSYFLAKNSYFLPQIPTFSYFFDLSYCWTPCKMLTLRTGSFWSKSKQNTFLFPLSVSNTCTDLGSVTSLDMDMESSIARLQSAKDWRAFLNPRTPELHPFTPELMLELEDLEDLENTDHWSENSTEASDETVWHVHQAVFTETLWCGLHFRKWMALDGAKVKMAKMSASVAASRPGSVSATGLKTVGWVVVNEDIAFVGKWSENVCWWKVSFQEQGWLGCTVKRGNVSLSLFRKWELGQLPKEQRFTKQQQHTTQTRGIGEVLAWVFAENSGFQLLWIKLIANGKLLLCYCLRRQQWCDTPFTHLLARKVFPFCQRRLFCPIHWGFCIWAISLWLSAR